MTGALDYRDTEPLIATAALLGAAVGVGIPHATGLFAIGLVLRRGYVSGESGTGQGKSHQHGNGGNESSHDTLPLCCLGMAGEREPIAMVPANPRAAAVGNVSVRRGP